MISSAVIIEQMLVICLLILVGAFLHKKALLTDEGARQLSYVIVHITNPAIMLSTAIEEETVIPVAQIGQAFALGFAAYALMALSGFLISLLLRSDTGDRIAIVMMSMYANVGFIGIPLALATLGPRVMVYVTVNNLVYSLLFYTTGTPLIRYAARLRRRGMTGNSSPRNGDGVRGEDGAGASTISRTGENRGEGATGTSAISHGDGRKAAEALREMLKGLLHTGTIGAIISIFIYLGHPAIPSIISDPLLYAGRCTTFLSMLVLGVSVASSPFRSYLTDRKTWIFVLLRGLIMPILVGLALAPFIHEESLRDAVLLLVAVPAGNLPMIVSREMELDDRLFARGIILSTLISPVTIPVSMALAHLLIR